MMKGEQARDAIKDALSKNECLTIYCNCEITYSGRAQAHLVSGDRIILIKSDNTLLVHQPQGSTPVNYMKGGADIVVGFDSSRVELRARESKEFLEIDINKTYHLVSHKLEDGQKLELVGNEADMSDMIRDNPTLIEDGFSPLSREEHTRVGFIDVFGHDQQGNLVIVECKRYSASLDAATQLRRYVEKMKKLRGIDKVRGIIASPEITKNAQDLLLEWGFEWKRVEPPKRLERFNKKQKRLGEF